MQIAYVKWVRIQKAASIETCNANGIANFFNNIHVVHTKWTTKEEGLRLTALFKIYFLKISKNAN